MNTRLFLSALFFSVGLIAVHCLDYRIVKPDIEKSFPRGNSVGQINYGGGPTEKIGPLAFEIWGQTIFIVNGGRFKVLEFDQEWNLTKEAIPDKRVSTALDIQYDSLYSNGVSCIYFKDEGTGGYFDELLNPASLPRDPTQQAKNPSFSFNNYLGKYVLGMDTIYFYKNHLKEVQLSNGKLIQDQRAVRSYLDGRMSKYLFAQKVPDLKNLLLDINGNTDSLVTDRYASFNNRSST